MTRPHGTIAEKRAAGLARYRRDFATGRVGTEVHSRSGRDLPPNRPRADVNGDVLEGLRGQGLSLRAIAKQMHIGLGTVVRTLRSRSKTFQEGSYDREVAC